LDAGKVADQVTRQRLIPEIRQGVAARQGAMAPEGAVSVAMPIETKDEA
jgi:hypothetical protein